MPANGAATLTCEDPESGAYAQLILAEKKAQLAGKGGTVTVAITGQAEVHATAQVQAAVQQQQKKLQQEQQDALGSRAPPPPPPTGVRIGPVNLGMRQSGPANPVRVNGLSNPWKAPADGLTIEAALGGNMPPRNRVVDTYVADDGGTAVSIKSLDWRGTSYKLEPSLIKSQMQAKIDEVANYRAGIDLYKPTPDPKDVSVWVFQLAYPANAPSPYLEQYQSLLAYGASKGITVQLIPIEG